MPSRRTRLVCLSCAESPASRGRPVSHDAAMIPRQKMPHGIKESHGSKHRTLGMGRCLSRRQVASVLRWRSVRRDAAMPSRRTRLSIASRVAEPPASRGRSIGHDAVTFFFYRCCLRSLLGGFPARLRRTHTRREYATSPPEGISFKGGDQSLGRGTDGEFSSGNGNPARGRPGARNTRACGATGVGSLGSSPRVASRTQTLKYFQSGDRAACGPLRKCTVGLAGPWGESRVPRPLTQGCCCHSDFEIFSVSLSQGCNWHTDFEIFSEP